MTMMDISSRLKTWWSSRQDDVCYSNLPQDDKDLGFAEEACPAYQCSAGPSKQDASRQFKSPQAATVAVLLLGSTILVTLIVLLVHLPLPNLKYQPFPTNQALHLLLPATSTDVNLCKILLSITVLGYPTPVLINWKAGHQVSAESGKLSHLQKLSGVIDYIKTLQPEQSQDLVVMVDAFDVWFQLPKEVLIERYNRLNVEADLRLATELDTSDIMRAEGISNRVIFASDKFCWLLEGAWCWLMPESPLSTDILGQRMAPNRWWILNEQVLPRYLNSGFIMGPAADVRAIFERAQEYILRETKPLESDQHYVSMVFAEQQLYRSMVGRQHNRGSLSRKPDQDTTSANKQAENEELNRLALIPGRRYEFGIHIDYASSLSHTGIRSAYDKKFLYFNTTPPTPELHLDPVYDCKPQLKPLSLEIEQSPGPFSPLELSDPDSALKWGDVPLYTDFCTGEIPVTIHHNGEKKLREELWPKFWMERRAKDVFAALVAKENARQGRTDSRIAGTVVQDGIKWREGSMIEYKDAAHAAVALAQGLPQSPSHGAVGLDDRLDIDVGGALGDGGEKLSWDDLCVKPGYEEKLFRHRE